MAIVLDPQEPAINRGIKTVGVGKKGSKALSQELVSELREDLKSGRVPPAARGAFIAGLLAKGAAPHEEVLLNEFGNDIAADASAFVQWVCRQLQAGHTLDKHTAYDLGKFLFSNETGDAARGWISSFLRVRYETDEEYEGLLQAMEDTLAPGFKVAAPAGEPIIQMAEPFDGVDHSYMVTPLVALFLQRQGYRVVHQVGRNSGPKFEMNLWDVAQALGIDPASSNADLANTKPDFGWFFHQSQMSGVLDRWVDLRHQIIKRPFLSTLERFVNPLNADILIASAFHPPYAEKMMRLAERAGFKKIIIGRNGIEGSIAFPLMREVRLLLSILQKNGEYRRRELVIDHAALVEVEEVVKKPKAVDNAALIKAYKDKGSSGNKHFDLRIKYTCDGLSRALEDLKE